VPHKWHKLQLEYKQRDSCIQESDTEQQVEMEALVREQEQAGVLAEVQEQAGVLAEVQEQAGVLAEVQEQAGVVAEVQEEAGILAEVQSSQGLKLVLVVQLVALWNRIKKAAFGIFCLLWCLLSRSVLS